MSLLLNTLKEIDGLGSYSKDKLAQKLNTSESVVEHLLAQLEERGYVKEEIINESVCSSCPKLNKGCYGVMSNNPIKALRITDKGKDLLELNH